MAAKRATKRKGTTKRRAKTSAMRGRSAKRGKVDPRNPRLITLLRSLEARRELAARFALRGMFLDNVGHDRAFAARIDELRKKLRLNDNGLATVLREADAISGAMLAQITGMAPTEEDTAPATSSARPKRRKKSTRASRAKSRSKQRMV